MHGARQFHFGFVASRGMNSLDKVARTALAVDRTRATFLRCADFFSGERRVGDGRDTNKMTLRQVLVTSSRVAKFLDCSFLLISESILGGDGPVSLEMGHVWED